MQYMYQNMTLPMACGYSFPTIPKCRGEPFVQGAWLFICSTKRRWCISILSRLGVVKVTVTGIIGYCDPWFW